MCVCKLVLGCAPQPLGIQASGSACPLSLGLQPPLPSLAWEGSATCFPPTPSWRPTLPGGLGGAAVSGPFCSAGAFPGSGLGCLPRGNGTGICAPLRGFSRLGSAAVGSAGGRCGEVPAGPGDSRRATTPLFRVDASSLMHPQPFPSLACLPHSSSCSCTSPGSSRAVCPGLHSSFSASPGYITLPLAVSWFQLHRLRPGTARGGAGELGTQTGSGWRPAGPRGIPQMGDGAPRDPVPPPPTCCPPPEISPGREKAQYLREACRDSVRNVGWEVRAGGGEEEPRSPSPWGWSGTGSKRDKGKPPGFLLLLLFGFPEFLRLFPRKLSQRPLSAPRGQRSVLEVAWDDVTSARALGRLPGRRPPPLSIPPPPLPPHLCPESDSNPVPSFPPLPSLGRSSLQVGNPGLEFCEGEGHGCGVAQRLCPFAGLREPGVTFPQVGMRTFLPSPLRPVKEPPSSLVAFPPAALLSVLLPPSPF